MSRQQKTPPHDKKLEDAVIGAIILEPSCFDEVCTILKPECFYTEENMVIFRAFIEMTKKKITIDLITVTRELRETNNLEIVGGAYGISVKTNSVVSAMKVMEHSMVLYQMYALRQIALIGMRISERAYEPLADCFEVMEFASKSISDINYIGRTSVVRADQAYVSLVEDLRHSMEHGLPPGIETGFKNIDKYLKKQPGDLIICGARPGMGKTVHMLNEAKHTAMILKKPTAFFSLEMPVKKLVGRLAASISDVNSKSINNGIVSHSEIMSIESNYKKLKDAPLYFDDSPETTINMLGVKIRRMVKELKIEEVYIDYLQLVTGSGKSNREQEVAEITRTLKKIAKAENVAITAGCQLSRKVEERADKRPQLSDLRESGAIEQDADIIYFLFRPQYYNLINEQTGLYEGQSFNGRYLPGENLLIYDVAKYREGDLFVAPLIFYGKYQLIENYWLDGIPVEDKPF